MFTLTDTVSGIWDRVQRSLLMQVFARRGQARATELAPDRAEHYTGRTVVERFNARLKDEFSGAMVLARGHRKVHAHLMVFADQILRLGT
jgi:hypothetical protein